MQRWIQGLRPYTIRVIASLALPLQIKDVIDEGGRRKTRLVARCPRAHFRKLVKVLGPRASGVRVYARAREDGLLHEVVRPARHPTRVEAQVSRARARRYWL